MTNKRPFSGFVEGLRSDVWNDLGMDPWGSILSRGRRSARFQRSRETQTIHHFYVLDKFPCSTKRLTRRKLLCLRSEEQAIAAEARAPLEHPTAVLAIRVRLVAFVVGAVCRTSATSDTVSAYRIPAV